MHLDGLTVDDHRAILEDLGSFWGTDRTRHLHHPMFVREFADLAFAARDGETLIGYLMGLRSQTGPVGYIHLVAVRDTHRGMGVARSLYTRFVASVRGHDVTNLRAITTEANTASIQFHRSLGFVTRLVPEYAGPGQDRILMECRLSDFAA